jgi:apolipoprotein D and lipocalin family protein
MPPHVVVPLGDGAFLVTHENGTVTRAWAAAHEDVVWVFPVSFEEGCTATTADYGPIDADTISVLNTCRKGSPDGPAERIAGTAEIVAPGELEVRFSGVPFVAADYWVLWVDADYRTAVVGVPSGRAGWILARTPAISPARRAEAEAVLSRNGYDPSRLYDVPQVAP